MRACIVLAIFFIATTQAAAVDERVQAACNDDYFTYCSQHDPDGQGVRHCMRASGSKLSDTCIEALMAAGELTPAERARYKQARRRGADRDR
jgi:hypothetical protein